MSAVAGTVWPVSQPSGLARAASIIGVVLALGGCTAPTSRSPAEDADDTVRVVKVIDGDTIRVAFDGRDERVRLIGIDTPEVPWYEGRGECFGVEAARYLKQRLGGRVVRLDFDVELRDRYGRLLAYAYINRELINLTLVRFGYAIADPVRPNTRLAALFAQAQVRARARGEGLWSRCQLT